MPFDGNGNWIADFSAKADRDANIKIMASRFDDIHQADLKESFENCLTKDGQIKPTQNFNANNHRVINVANPVSDTDAVNYGTMTKGDNTYEGNISFSGDNTFTGFNTFESGKIQIQHNEEVLGQAPSSNIYSQLRYLDKNGVVTAVLQKIHETNGAVSLELNCRNKDNTSNAWFRVGFDSSGKENASASTAVRESIVRWSVPRYSSTSTFSQNTTITATGLCCVYGQLEDIPNVGSWVTINGRQMLASSVGNGKDVFFFILNKGDTYLVRSNGSKRWVCPLGA